MEAELLGTVGWLIPEGIKYHAWPGQRSIIQEENGDFFRRLDEENRIQASCTILDGIEELCTWSSYATLPLNPFITPLHTL